jgi:RimJ/RimL family protein N-acetyltransferase
MADAYTLWLWANDPDARAASHDRPVISWVDHVRWLAARTEADDARVWIADSESAQPLGVVRFESADHWRTARLSYAIAPESRGLGFGTAVVVAGVSRLRETRPAAQVWADVRRENERSIRVFEGLGWRREEREIGLVRFWAVESRGETA